MDTFSIKTNFTCFFYFFNVAYRKDTFMYYICIGYFFFLLIFICVI